MSSMSYILLKFSAIRLFLVGKPFFGLRAAEGKISQYSPAPTLLWMQL